MKLQTPSIRPYVHTSILLCFLTLLLTSCQSGNISDPALTTSPSAVQAEQEFKTLDEQYLEIAKQVPEFAGIYEGNDGVLVAKIASSATLKAQQVPSEEVTVAEVKNAILEVMGPEVFTGVPNDLAASGSLQTLQETASSVQLRLENTKYTFEQLTTWRLQIAALDLDGAMIYDANEGKNNVYLGIETQVQADAAKARIAKLSLPSDAVELQVVGPYDDLVLKGEELQEYTAQQEEDTEITLEATAAEQDVEQYNNPLVGGMRMDILNLGLRCTYGFSAKRNGVVGFVSNSHCTKYRNSVDGAEVFQGGSKIGYETADASARPCGPIWTVCRYADAAFFKNTGTRIAKPRIAGTGPNPGDKTYTYTSVLTGQLFSTTQNEHYIAITSRTGFTRLKVINTCTYLKVNSNTTTIECGAVAIPESGYPYVNKGDSGSPVITRNGLESVLVGQIFGGNTFLKRVWINNVGGIRRDLGDLDTRWGE